MSKRIITVILTDNGYDSICEGDMFVSGLCRDELIGRLNMLVCDRLERVGLQTEEQRLALIRHRNLDRGAHLPRWEPQSHDYHPLRHGGNDPKLGDLPVAEK